MIRVFAWAVFLGLLYYGAQLVGDIENPWASLSAPVALPAVPATVVPAVPATVVPAALDPAALRIPGCGDKPGCQP